MLNYALKIIKQQKYLHPSNCHCIFDFKVLDGSAIGLVVGGTILLLIVVVVIILIVRCKVKNKQTQSKEQQNAIYGTGTFFCF